MKISESYPITLPEWSLCPLMYGDDDTLTTEETAALDKFEQWCNDCVEEVDGSHYTIEYGNEEAYFTANTDVDSLACNAIDATLHIFA